VHAAAKDPSFAAAAEDLREQAELDVGVKRVQRAARRIGQERMAEHQAAMDHYQQLPFPARQQSPVEQVPQVACVQMDGGRFQMRTAESSQDAGEEASGKEESSSQRSRWREMKVGVLLSMSSPVSKVDPCPELPATFADPGHMRKIAREIKGFTHDAPVSATSVEETPPPASERAARPEPLVKSVVARHATAEEFAPLLASAAYERGFHAAPRKAFVADGAEANWSAWRAEFSHYTPILDFVHALMYVYAAALAGCTTKVGWALYRDWAQWLWAGQVDRVIAALEIRQQELGTPAAGEKGTPRAQVATSLNYLRNHRERMRYDEYRRQGLPITSNHVESTIKQINRRMKGTEKFWSISANPMLALVADQLTNTPVVRRFWHRRTARIIQEACFNQAG
jgi:hypothetical protein